MLISGEQLCIRNVLLLAKAKETPNHVWLHDHTSLFTLTIETKTSFKDGNIQNIIKHTTKSYQTKNTTDFILALYSPNTYWTNAVERERLGMALNTATSEKYSASGHYLQNKTSQQSVHRTSTEHSCNT